MDIDDDKPPSPGEYDMKPFAVALCLVVFVLALLWSLPAQSQVVGCYPSIKDVEERLEDLMRQGRVAVCSVRNSGSVFHDFADENTGTWTMVEEYPSGRSCILQTGGGYLTITREQGDRS